MWLSLYVTVPYSSSLHLSSSLYILLFLPTVTPMSDCIWWAARLHSEIFPHRQCRCLGCLDPGSPPRAPFLSGNIRKHILWRSLKHFEDFWSIWESDRSKAALLLSERPSMAGNPQCSSSDEISISFENGINMTHLVFYMSYIDIDDIGTSVLYKSWMRHRIGNERHQDLCWTRLCHHRLRHHRLTRYRLSHHHCCSALLLWHLEKTQMAHWSHRVASASNGAQWFKSQHRILM